MVIPTMNSLHATERKLSPVRCWEQRSMFCATPRNRNTGVRRGSVWKPAANEIMDRKCTMKIVNNWWSGVPESER